MPGTSSAQDSAHGSLAGDEGSSTAKSPADGAGGGHSSQPGDGSRRSCHGSSADQGSTGRSADERGSRSSAGQSRSSGFEDGGRSQGPLTRAPRRVFGSRGHDTEQEEIRVFGWPGLDSVRSGPHEDADRDHARDQADERGGSLRPFPTHRREDRVDQWQDDQHVTEPQDGRDRGNDDATASLSNHAGRC